MDSYKGQEVQQLLKHTAWVLNVKRPEPETDVSATLKSNDIPPPTVCQSDSQTMLDKAGSEVSDNDEITRSQVKHVNKELQVGPA